jgi:hypothetical protein
MLWLIDLAGYMSAERVAIDRRCSLQIGHGNGDMVQAADHSDSFP